LAPLLAPQKKLDEGAYKTPVEFEKDVMLIWDNCMTYNAVRAWQKSKGRPSSPLRRSLSQGAGRKTSRVRHLEF